MFTDTHATAGSTHVNASPRRFPRAPPTPNPSSAVAGEHCCLTFAFLGVGHTACPRAGLFPSASAVRLGAPRVCLCDRCASLRGCTVVYWNSLRLRDVWVISEFTGGAAGGVPGRGVAGQEQLPSRYHRSPKWPS